MNATSPTPTQPALEMRGVAISSMRDPGAVMVEDVNWRVAAGDYWAVGGLQGAGKSDFIAMTGGLTAPARGEYFFCGRTMPIFEDDRLDERLRLGIVFDGGQLFNHLTVSENISLPVRYHRNLSKAGAAAATWQMLELTELAPWADSTPGAMSRNWQKRVGLARALMLKPEVLVLDNPLAGLDLRHRVWWLDFLEQLSKGHAWTNGSPMTLVATANDLRPWRHHARQFAVLKGKRLIVLGGWETAQAAAGELADEPGPPVARSV